MEAPFLGGRWSHVNTNSPPLQRKYPPELRERAVRMVAETIAEAGERHGAVTNVARQLGISTESLSWLRQAEIDAGTRPSSSGEERERLRVLERVSRELRQANAILKSAAPSRDHQGA